uniref:Uncharacterized protein n=1 Tax=Tanacetum cinerariifolium TaxID=118510 RepID=A0A699GND6_TANCI|nr:hypothetical protein [Tanacetum cinerariifolium]
MLKKASQKKVLKTTFFIVNFHGDYTGEQCDVRNLMVIILEETKLRKKSVIKQTGGDVKAKALWKTAVSVIANNLGFLVLVLLLAQIVRHTAKVKKILELHVDRNLKLGSKRVTKRVRDESGKLRKRMDDESGKFNKRFRETDAKIRILKGVLNGIQWLTIEEFDKFVEEFKGWKGGEMGLDEIQAFAKGVVEKEIEKIAKWVVDNEIEKMRQKLCG